MPHSPWAELGADAAAGLLAVARRSISCGIDARAPVRIDLADYDEKLTTRTAVFVTLTSGGALRGCVGSLQPLQPLVQAVADSAFNAAFRDRRFAPLRADELPGIHIELSILTAPEPIAADSRRALLEQLRPGIDGLIIEDRGRRATFLPRVWEKIPVAEDFLDQLFLKAGLAAGHWSGSLRLQRYQAHSFSE